MPAQTPSMTRKPRNESVADNLTGLLDSNSKFVKSARTRSGQASNRRGLSNSSIAVQAGEEAAIRTALPIAQQDASQAAASNLSSQKNIEAGGLIDKSDANKLTAQTQAEAQQTKFQTAQNIDDLASQTQAEGAQSSLLDKDISGKLTSQTQAEGSKAALLGTQIAGDLASQTQAEAQQTSLLDTQIAASLTAQTQAELAGLTAQAQDELSKATLQSAAIAGNLTAQTQAEVAALSSQAQAELATAGLLKTDIAGQLASQTQAEASKAGLLSTQIAGDLASQTQAEAQQTKTQEAAIAANLALQNLDIVSKENIAKLNVDSNDRDRASSISAIMLNSISAARTAINNNPDIPSGQRAFLLKDLAAREKASLAVVEGLYGVKIQWPTLSDPGNPNGGGSPDKQPTDDGTDFDIFGDPIDNTTSGGTKTGPPDVFGDPTRTPSDIDTDAESFGDMSEEDQNAVSTAVESVTTTDIGNALGIEVASVDLSGIDFDLSQEVGIDALTESINSTTGLDLSVDQVTSGVMGAVSVAIGNSTVTNALGYAQAIMDLMDGKTEKGLAKAAITTLGVVSPPLGLLASIAFAAYNFFTEEEPATTSDAENEAADAQAEADGMGAGGADEGKAGTGVTADGIDMDAINAAEEEAEEEAQTEAEQGVEATGMGPGGSEEGTPGTGQTGTPGPDPTDTSGPSDGGGDGAGADSGEAGGDGNEDGGDEDDGDDGEDGGGGGGDSDDGSEDSGGDDGSDGW